MKKLGLIVSLVIFAISSFVGTSNASESNHLSHIKKAANIWIEAETAKLRGGLAVDKSKAAFASAKSVLGIHTEQPNVTGKWNFEVAEDLKNAKLAIRFACFDGDVAFTIGIDKEFLGDIELPDTGGWGNQNGHWKWGIVDLKTKLSKGPHLLTLKSVTKTAGVNVDCFAFLPEDYLVPLKIELTEKAEQEKAKEEVPDLTYVKMLVDYYETVVEPKPFLIRKGKQFEEHRDFLRKELLKSVSLWPLPEKTPLDVHETEVLDHPWCTIKKVYYKYWPGIYAPSLLYTPKNFRDKPAPAVLCPHGHWPYGGAYPDVQKRCLTLAKMGYVVLVTPQDHYESLNIGLSHQTHHIWRNIRALDYLESLPIVDKTRIGCAGASGGGLQTQMLVALDDRIKAATIVGLTCDFREIAFPDAQHCHCNHFPNEIMYTDWPEISALGMPSAVQYLIMDDWSGHFERDNFPTVKNLYAANGYPESVDCKYWPTPHIYDKAKRERTYWWMEKWLQGEDIPQSGTEPDEIQTFEPNTLINLSANVPGMKNVQHLNKIFYDKYHFKTPAIASKKDLLRYKRKMVGALKTLIGEDVALLKNKITAEKVNSRVEGGLLIEEFNYPSEANLMIPATVIRKVGSTGKLPVVMLCSPDGRKKMLQDTTPDSAMELARKGNMVVLPDIRFTGDLSFNEAYAIHAPSCLKFEQALPNYWGADSLKYVNGAWDRNTLIFGRPTAGMGSTDIRAVLDGLKTNPGADLTKVTVISKQSAVLASSVLFSAILDSRIVAVDVDLDNFSYKQNRIPSVPFILRHGDVLEWSSLLANKRLTLRNVPAKAGDTKWLVNVFEVMGNSKGLKIVQ